MKIDENERITSVDIIAASTIDTTNTNAAGTDTDKQDEDKRQTNLENQTN